MSNSQSLNKVEMIMIKDDNLDSYLLLPCCEDGCSNCGKGNRNVEIKPFKHSLSGWFEVENKPLRINTVYFVGSPRKLKTQLKRKEKIDLGKADKKFDENFKGVNGLTFPLDRPDGSSLVIIWMPKFDWSIFDFETLSHECLHASVMVMRMSGVRSKIFTASKDLDVDDEGLCYHQSTMLTNLIKKMVGKQNKMFKKCIEDK